MKKSFRFIGCTFVCMSIFIFTGVLGSCSKKNKTPVVRYLNFKPEVANYYLQVASVYEEETGVKVIVETAANNVYEAALSAKMSSKDAPTLFQLNGPRGYANWKDYCADLSDTELYKHLSDKSLAITANGKVYGIPYVVEGYGIIYNKAITDKYFALPSKAVKYTSMDQINNFDALKAVVLDMQKNANKLGIDGVFACTSLKAGEDWRWQTHLTNIPITYEFMDNNVDLTSDSTREITFEFGANYKNIFDLYLNNSTISRKLVGSKTVADSMAEFALEKCAMVQNGNWAWSQIAEVSGNKVLSENIKFLPIYTGMPGEENQGLCIGTENFYAINAKASPEDQKATADFIYWLYSSDVGKNFVTNLFGFIAPFDTFSQAETPKDPLAVEVVKWMEKPNVYSIPWNFTLFPSGKFKEDFGSSLLQYAQGAKSWYNVEKDMVYSWDKESNALANN
ncbi:MAG: ABC transporter substrate-binding protein [Treponema sp.]|nr:ABC transporter substrate-binding protein [Treponema sp.]